jgi:hypothetical protein
MLYLPAALITAPVRKSEFLELPDELKSTLDKKISHQMFRLLNK